MAKTAIDFDTGELIVEPDFVKLYTGDLCRIKGVNSGQYKMFNFMLDNMNHDNLVSFGPSAKANFVKIAGMKNQTFNLYVSGLISSKLIERVGRGEFRVNKKYAVKVDWTKVQSIKWTTEYTRKGKTETVEIVQ